ncbi:MAG: hypothetical protein II200_01725 [Bacteroidaceae bacterium]|nr:hypothetical protein [Bacteroidaceae bacterium]
MHIFIAAKKAAIVALKNGAKRLCYDPATATPLRTEKNPQRLLTDAAELVMN